MAVKQTAHYLCVSVRTLYLTETLAHLTDFEARGKLSFPDDCSVSFAGNWAARPGHVRQGQSESSGPKQGSPTCLAFCDPVTRRGATFT
jgi:hypothetical protein